MHSDKLIVNPLKNIGAGFWFVEASIFNIYSGQEGHFSSDEFCIFWMWLETGHI